MVSKEEIERAFWELFNKPQPKQPEGTTVMYWPDTPFAKLVEKLREAKNGKR